MAHSNIIDLNQYYGIIKVLGDNNTKFLQGQLTCDVTQVSENNPGYGCYCNIKGRVEAIFWIFKIKDDYYLRVPQSLVEYFVTELNKYAIFSKVQVTKTHLPFNHYAIIGNLDEAMQPAIHFSYSKINVPNLHEIFTPLTLKTTNDIVFWQQQLIHNQLAEIHPEIIGHFLPHNLGLVKLGAISFTKGCYRGQEIIARMEHLGNIKYKVAAGKVINCSGNLALVEIPV